MNSALFGSSQSSLLVSTTSSSLWAPSSPFPQISSHLASQLYSSQHVSAQIHLPFHRQHLPTPLLCLSTTLPITFCFIKSTQLLLFHYCPHFDLQSLNVPPNNTTAKAITPQRRAILLICYPLLPSATHNACPLHLICISYSISAYHTMSYHIILPNIKNLHIFHIY